MMINGKQDAPEKAKKLAYEKPVVEVIGRMEELTGSSGSNYDDGWYYSQS